MRPREKTAFELDFERRMEDGEFRAAYEEARARIGAIDALVQKLDAARETQGLTKAELARRMRVRAEVVRRLFSTDQPNPTINTVVGIANALGFEVTAVPKRTTRRKSSSPRRKRTSSRGHRERVPAA